VSNWRHLFLRYLLAALLAATMPYASGADKEVRIGVLSFRTLEQTSQQWQATADYLNRHVGGYRFSIVPMYHQELDLAMSRHELDFVLTNPEHYVNIRADDSVSATATLMPLAEGRPVTTFGGVIMARADRGDITTLDDVRGKVVASPSAQSLGGYLMQRWTLYKHGLDISELAHMQFTGLPQDKVVLQVLNGKADIGFVRTGVLESMAREGKIRLDQFKVLNRQPAESFPQLLSTDLYPEWPFVAMPEVPDKLVKQVTLALMNIQPKDTAAQQGGYYGFAPAGNYAAVEAMMQRLNISPEQEHEFYLRNILRKYAFEMISAGLVILMLVVATLLFLARANRNLQHSYRERKRLAEELGQANVKLEEKVAKRTQELLESQVHLRVLMDSISEGMYGVDTDGNCTFVNNAFLRLLGFEQADEVLGKHIHNLIHHSYANGKPHPEADCLMYQAFKSNQTVHSDQEVFWRKDGVAVPVEYWSQPITKDDKVIGAVATFLDITERKQLEVQMHDLAFYDSLTKLPNRRLLLDRLNKALLSCSRTRRHGALMYLDLDHFKTLNDLHGHDIGDEMLAEVANRILACIREQDSAARFGGDEFVVMLEGLSEEMPEAVTQAEGVAEKIRAALARPYQLKRSGAASDADMITHYCSSSIGVTIFRNQDEGMEQLLKWTDMAMYRAKDAGRNVIRFFDPEMQTAIEMRAALESDLHIALEQQQFILLYQVQVNASGKPQGAEVLLRWRHPQRGLVLPAQFIPMAEEIGLIIPIGAWALNTACAQIKLWQEKPPFRNLVLAVNVSAKQFRQPDFVEQVQNTVSLHGISPTSLKLELTEGLVLDNVEDAIAKMKALKEFGVSLSMDDFGTGYSSLSYLKRLPLDQIKIDQSFIRDITTDHGDMVMVMTLVDLSMNFEVDVLPEGVETEAQFKLLKRYGCTSFQGHLFSKPLPVEEFEAWVLQKLAR